MPLFSTCGDECSSPLSPGLLPTGLRVLLLNDTYTQLLQPDSLPSTLTFLHLGSRFDEPLAPGVLPTSLRDLYANGYMREHHRLWMESLPASLERLRLPLPVSAADGNVAARTQSAASRSVR